MNYELEGKLRDKADSWKVYELENQIRHLKSEIDDLKAKNDYWQGKFNNVFRAIEELTNLLAYNNFDDNILNNVKNLLY